ncbi:hypothetical protein JCM6882_005772 [Rhodosporidiobolus microsporus]
MDPQAEAQAKFSQLGFFVLPLPKGSEFGVDGRLWQVASFSGVKFLPSGFHLFVFSAAPSAAQQAHLPESLSSGVGVRHGILRFFRQGDRVVEEWDNAREELKRSTPRKVRRTAEGEKGGEREQVAVSDEYLKTLDASLAPYPEKEIAEQWASLSGFVTEKTLSRVVGVDEQGCALVDALLGSSSDADAAGPDGGRRVWGKEREADDDDEEEPRIKEVVEEEEEDKAAPSSDLLEFVSFDVKRSWPTGAVGAELSRWSKDKSWQLSEVVRNQLDDDPKEILAELQLSFLLFTLLHNFSSLSVYKSLFSLVCRSTTLAHPPSSRTSTGSLPSSVLDAASLPLFASFLFLFLSQVTFLEADFFTTHLPSLEKDLLDSLAVLSQALSDALPSWLDLGAKDPKVAEVWKEVVKRWDALAALAMEKFGWDLGVIRGSKAGYLTGAGRPQREEDEVDFEDLEEGEDAPVIVDDEGLYARSDEY